MAVLNGFASSITGSSGSTNALEGKSGWYVYVFPRGAYASAASTATTITFDSTDESGRFANNDWIQVGTSTANIRQVTGAAGGSITVNTAITVSVNDRVHLIGTTQPTVSGGSATYQPNTTIYPRDNNAATQVTNSKLTTDSSGNYQFFAADAFYDLMVQDSNQSNQGALINVPVGLATTGSLVADGVNTRDLGSDAVEWKDIYYAGTIFHGLSNLSGATAFHLTTTTAGLTQGNLFAMGMSTTTLVYGDTYGGIHDSWTIGNVINVKSTRFGAKGDDSTIDTTAIANGITHARTSSGGSTGAQVYLPKGKYKIDSTLVLPNHVGLRGDGSRGTYIVADSTFPTDQPLIRIGDGTGTNAHSCMIEDLCIDCSQISGSIGVYSTEANEESGLRNVLIINYEDAGVFFDGAQNQNVRVLNSSFAHTNATATGISFNTVSSKNLIMDVTCTSNNATQSTNPGIGITNSFVQVVGYHVESHDDGIWYGANATGMVSGAYGHSTVNNVIKLDQTGVLVLNCTVGGSTNLVSDTANGVTLTAALANSGGWYMSSNDAPIGGTRSTWTSSTDATNQVNPATIFGGTVSWGAQRLYQTAGLMTGPPFESVAAASSITISRNRIQLTGGATTISTINPITSDMEGTEILIQNAAAGDKTFDENGNLLIAGAATNVLTLGDIVRFVAVGTTWYQSSSRMDH